MPAPLPRLRRLAWPAPDGRRWLYVPYDQLNVGLGPLSREDPAELGAVLVESPWKAARRPYHRQKLALVLANQRRFALELAERGVAVRYEVASGPYHKTLRKVAREVGPLRCMRPAERELRHDLAPLARKGEIEELPRRQGPGNAIVLDVECENVTAVFTSFGQRGVRAERVAILAARHAVAYLGKGAAVDTHLADQLLLPLALNAGGTFRTTLPLDAHFTTNAELIREWLAVAIDVDEETTHSARVTVRTD